MNLWTFLGIRTGLVDTRSEDTDGHTLRPVLVDTRSDFTDGLALWPKPCQLYGRETLRPSRKIQISEIDKLYGRSNFMAKTVTTLRTIKLYGRSDFTDGQTLRTVRLYGRPNFTDGQSLRTVRLYGRLHFTDGQLETFTRVRIACRRRENFEVQLPYKKEIPLDLARRRRENFDI